MKLLLTRSGGHLPGYRPPPRALDTQGLPPDVAARVESLVDAIARAPKAAAGGYVARDGQTFKIAVQKDGGELLLTGSDGSMTPEFAELLSLIESGAPRG